LSNQLTGGALSNQLTGGALSNQLTGGALSNQLTDDGWWKSVILLSYDKDYRGTLHTP
jgi:hypothetical protein